MREFRIILAFFWFAIVFALPLIGQEAARERCLSLSNALQKKIRVSQVLREGVEEDECRLSFRLSKGKKITVDLLWLSTESQASLAIRKERDGWEAISDLAINSGEPRRKTYPADLSGLSQFWNEGFVVRATTPGGYNLFVLRRSNMTLTILSDDIEAVRSVKKMLEKQVVRLTPVKFPNE